MQRVAFFGEHHAGERAGEHEMTGLERNLVLAELVGEPGDAERGMAEHAGSDAGLFDLGVAIHNAADPAQIDLQRTDRPPMTIPAAAPLSDTVSKILRGSCSRASTISIAGTTYSVARSTSGRPIPGPRNSLPRMKASSISTRGRQ